MCGKRELNYCRIVQILLMEVSLSGFREERKKQAKNFVIKILDSRTSISDPYSVDPNPAF
jgi:hypothetical protein